MPSPLAGEHVIETLHAGRSSVTALIQGAEKHARGEQMLAEPAWDNYQEVCCVEKLRTSACHH